MADQSVPECFRVLQSDLECSQGECTRALQNAQECSKCLTGDLIISAMKLVFWMLYLSLLLTVKTCWCVHPLSLLSQWSTLVLIYSLYVCFLINFRFCQWKGVVESVQLHTMNAYSAVLHSAGHQGVVGPSEFWHENRKFHLKCVCTTDQNFTLQFTFVKKIFNPSYLSFRLLDAACGYGVTAYNQN